MLHKIKFPNFFAAAQTFCLHILLSLFTIFKKTCVNVVRVTTGTTYIFFYFFFVYATQTLVLLINYYVYGFDFTIARGQAWGCGFLWRRKPGVLHCLVTWATFLLQPRDEYFCRSFASNRGLSVCTTGGILTTIQVGIRRQTYAQSGGVHF